MVGSSSSNHTIMSRSSVLLVLASILPSYIAAFSSSVAAIAIAFISTVLGFILTISLMNEYDEKEVREGIRLGWILHIIGMLVVYTIHQLG